MTAQPSKDFSVKTFFNQEITRPTFHTEYLPNGCPQLIPDQPLSDETEENKDSFIVVKKDIDMKEKFVTTKELAQIIGVDVRTVQLTVKKLDLANVLSQIKINGKLGYVYNKEQATLVKQEIQKHHNLASRQIDSVSTEKEIIENAMKAFQALDGLRLQKIAELEAERDKAIKDKVVAENTVKRIADTSGLFSVNQTAKILKLPYGDKTLFRKLRELKILNLDNSPAQNQVNSEHFKVVIKQIPIGNKSVTLITSKGIVYLAKRFNTEIDKEYMDSCLEGVSL